MAKMTKAALTNDMSLANALIQIFEPITSALDANNDAQVDGMGHARPSTEDAGNRIMLDQMANQVYRQLRGSINSKTGVKYDNVTERFLKSQEDMYAHTEKYSGDTDLIQSDPRTYVIGHWLLVNEARFHALTELLDGICLAYQEIVGKPWVFVEQAKRAEAASGAALTDSVKKAMLAKFTRRPTVAA
jgi:hypothetical protein